MKRSSLAFLLFLIFGCAAPHHSSQGTNRPSAERETAWTPGPMAASSLQALWTAAPFQLAPASLAQASGGAVPLMHDEEVLLLDRSTSISPDGASVDVTRTVWRILRDDPNQTVQLTWAPWRQDKPKVRARVVTEAGQEHLLDPTSVVEGSMLVGELQISDVHRLQVPLPNARRGSVVELEVTIVSRQPLVAGAGRTATEALWTFAPVRKRRFHLEVPAAVPLKVEVVGVATPRVVKSGEMQRLDLEVGELPFKFQRLTHAQRLELTPRFGWSTATSWADVATRYGQLIESVANQPVNVKLPVASNASAREKVQAALRFVRERLRYTAVHLGEGAIIPTSPSQVLSRGYGDCKDLSVLVASVLRAHQLDASVALTAVHSDIPREGLPGLEAFNHMVVVVNDRGQRLWIDPTAPEFPAGTLPIGTLDQRALIAGKPQGLVATPRRDEMPFDFKALFELQFAPFGNGSARVTVSAEGASEGLWRDDLKRCDENEARSLVGDDVKLLFDDATYVASVSGCRPGEGAVKATAVLAKSDAIDTGDREASTRLPSNVVDALVPSRIIGPQPGSDSRKDEAKEDDARRLRERSGLTEEDLKHVAWHAELLASNERIYRITLPPRFSVPTLIPSRTLKLGPSTLTETARQVDAQTVEVSFHYRLDKTDWTAEDVDAFRAAYWKRYEENMPVLSAFFEPARLIDDNRAPEAVALMRKWLAESPTDGATRARFARVLLGLGLGDLARQEVDRAVKDAPTNALCHMIRADVARHDSFGVLYQAPFDRAVTLESLRQALKLMPEHDWANSALSETLIRNSQGEIDRWWVPDTAEAAALLQQRVERKVASKSQMSLLAQIYTRARRLPELRKLFELDPESRSPSDPAMAAFAEAVMNGPQASIARINRLDSPKDRFMGIVASMGIYLQQRRYDDARAVLQYEPGPALKTEMARLRAMGPSLKPIPPLESPRSAEDAARRLIGILYDASTPSDAARIVGDLSSSEGKRNLDGTSKSLMASSLPALDNELSYLLLFHSGKCTTHSAGPFSRVRCDVPDAPQMSVTTYWLKEGAAWKLESVGAWIHFARRAWGLAQSGKTEEAAGWVGWFIDHMQASKFESTSGQLLKDFWGQARRTDRNDVRFAAALAHLAYAEAAEKAPAEVIEAVEQARTQLSGSLRRRADSVLVFAYELRGDYLKAIKTLEPLAQSEGEPWMWRRLASLESHSGQVRNAEARIQTALARDAMDVSWRQLQATTLLRSGRYGDAVQVLEKLRAEKGEGVDVSNNLLWARLMARTLDDDAERESMRLISSERKPSDSEVHTAAMVLLERGKVKQAAELGLRRSQNLAKVDDAQWLFRGRLLKSLGYPDQSKLAFAKMTNEDPELNDLRKRWELPQ